MARVIGLNSTLINKERQDRIRAEAPGFEVVDLSGGYTREQLAACEVLFGHIDASELAHADKLKWFHSQSAGVEYYLRPGVRLPELFTNSAGAYGVGIAEHLVAMAMMLQRHMPGYVRNQGERVWRGLGKVKCVYGSVVAVVGLGDIGGQFARRMHALGARVRGVARSPRAECPAYLEAFYTAERIDEALDGADIVALCMPGTGETTGVFSRERIFALKRGAILLNIGRGSAVDEHALIEALEGGHLFGAGLDVTAREPLPPESRLWEMENIIITPHVSGGTSLDLTLDLLVERFVEYLKDYAAGRPFVKVVDRTLGY